MKMIGLPAYIIPFMFIAVPAVILQGNLVDCLIAVGAETIGILYSIKLKKNRV